MRNRKYSRLRLYIITTFFAFVVSSAVTSFFIVKYSNDYLQTAVSYVNEKVPVNIEIKNVSIDYPLRIVLNDLKIYSKTNNQEVYNKEFLSIPSSSIFFNPLKILVGRGLFYCISDVYINDAYLYPSLIDNKLFLNSSHSNDNINIKTKIEHVLYVFEGKNIRVDNFNIDIADSLTSENTRLSLQYIRADLKSGIYSLDTALFLQEDTDIRLSISTKKDISYLDTKLLINNNKHPILDFYMTSSIDSNNVLNVDLKNSNDNNIGYVNYDYNKNHLKFDITNVSIQRERIRSFYDAVSSIPILKKLALNNSFSNVLNEFANINLYANGEIEKNKVSKLDMNVSSIADNFKLDFDVKVTNNIVYSTNFYIRSENGSLDARFTFPISNPLLANADISVFDVNIDTNTFSMDVNIKPTLSNSKRVISRLYINSLKYKEAIAEPVFFDIEYLKNNQLINISIVTNNFIKPHITTIYLAKESTIKVKSEGTIDNDILTPFLGSSIVSGLNSSIDIDYKLHNTNNYFVNDLILNLKKMYTEETLATIDLSAYSNKVILKNLDYNLGTNSISLNFDAAYYKNGEVELDGNLSSIIGKQKIIASLKNSNSYKMLNVHTEDGMFLASGSIASNGNIKFDIETPKPIEINDIIIDTKISVDNITKENGEYSIWGYLNAEKQKLSIFNLAVNFEVTNNSLAFTNISYSYRDVTIIGNATLSRENNITTLTSVLRDIHSSGYFTTSFTLNKDNIFGNIDMVDMPLALGTGERDIYGVINTKVIIMGLLEEPIVHVNSFSVKDFEIPGNRFDISLSGSYKKEELILTNIVITKTGQSGFVISQSANKIEQILIPSAYFSKDVQNVSMEIVNMFYLSRVYAKINYSMKKSVNGDYEYRLTTSPIKVNNRKLPAFSSIATYNGNNLILKSSGTHGIDGNIKKNGTNYLVDINYLYDNKDFLNVYGGIKEAKSNQVDLMVTSSTMNVEIFELFSTLFTSITAAKTNFSVGDNEYTLNARVHGDIDNLAIDGRFLGKGSRIKLSYFSDKFIDTDVDILFEGHKIKVGKLEFYTKNKKWLKLTGEGDFTYNTISYMNFEILSSDEQIGLLYADANIEILRSRGPVHIDLNMGGSLLNPRLSGTITLIKNDVQLTMGPENTYTERTFDIASKQYFDLTIQALRSIRVAHNLVGDVYIENGSSMGVSGSKEQGINLQGTINFERGSIYYLQNIYNIERGYVTFPYYNSLDPIINAVAYTYTKYIPPNISLTANQNLDAYNVTLYMEMNTRISEILFNTSSDSLPVRFYSIPTLGQSQVNQLAGIATIVASEESHIYAENTTQANENATTIGEQLQQQAIQSYSDLLIRNIALRPFERWLRQFIGIDYINVSSAVVNNLLYSIGGANNSLFSILDKTSVSIGKYASKDLYFKYDVTYRFNDPERPIMLGKSENPYYFENQFGFEVSLLRDFKLANFLFEYKINPFDINIIKQEFNVLIRWRL